MDAITAAQELHEFQLSEHNKAYTRDRYGDVNGVAMPSRCNTDRNNYKLPPESRRIQSTTPLFFFFSNLSQLVSNLSKSVNL